MGQTLRPGRAGGEPCSLPAARVPGTLAPSTGAPAHGGREGAGMRIQGEDLARVVVAGLAAAFLAGLLTVLWTAPEPLPQATLIGAVVVIGLITAAGYRHVGALAAAGAVLTLLGAAQLYSVSIPPLAVLEEARRGGGSVDEMLQGPAYSLLLGCLLLVPPAAGPCAGSRPLPASRSTAGAWSWWRWCPGWSPSGRCPARRAWTPTARGRRSCCVWW